VAKWAKNMITECPKLEQHAQIENRILKLGTGFSCGFSFFAINYLRVFVKKFDGYILLIIKM
jgi:hypothetical protein